MNRKLILYLTTLVTILAITNSLHHGLRVQQRSQLLHQAKVTFENQVNGLKGIKIDGAPYTYKEDLFISCTNPSKDALKWNPTRNMIKDGTGVRVQCKGKRDCYSMLRQFKMICSDGATAQPRINNNSGQPTKNLVANKGGPQAAKNATTNKPPQAAKNTTTNKAPQPAKAAVASKPGKKHMLSVTQKYL